MAISKENINLLKKEIARLQLRFEFSKTVEPDYFEPGMMEYLDQSYGSFDEDTGEFLIRFESRGTRYDGRTEQLEKVKVGDPIRVVRDADNRFNANNFLLFTEKGKDVGNMPAELCNVIAPIYDEGLLIIQEAKASFVEPISKRSRYAKQAILFVEMQGKVFISDKRIIGSAPIVETPDESEINDSLNNEDLYALQLDLKDNSFFVGGYEIKRGVLLQDIRQKPFCENAKEIQDLKDADCLHVLLRHIVDFAGEKWVATLLFRNGEFRDLWLEHSRLFQQRSLLANSASNPRMRKERAALFSKLKNRLDEMIGSKGEQTTDGGNLQYIYGFDDHGVMLVQDNHLPAVVIYVQSYGQKEMEEIQRGT